MRRSIARSMTNPRDTRFMTTALRLAQAAAEAGEAPIGALIVDPATDSIIAQAHNRPIAGHDPTAHAEILALREAAQKLGNYRLTGLELYVTLEPCAMCAGAISHARIGRLVFGASDAKGGAVISGPRFFDQPTCHWRPEVVSGVLADEGAILLKDFFRERRKAKAGSQRPV
ncbi:tRNA adenosine(34) deaminase TadA [uncultured Maricaulis sp.]|uniref:tRNA adenosine(34) deaminase TadA n=1 Tax=uncultured Maricaulis sp. TaxID=174710 RepID=UPI0030D7EE07